MGPRITHNKAVSVLSHAIFTFDPLVCLTAADTLMVRVNEKPTNATRTPATGNGALIPHYLEEDPRPSRKLVRHRGTEGSVSTRSLRR